MFNKYKEFTEKRPYIHIILIMIATSFIGVLIEFIVSGNFIGSGLYTAIALTLIELLRVRRRNKSKN